MTPAWREIARITGYANEPARYRYRCDVAGCPHSVSTHVSMNAADSLSAVARDARSHSMRTGHETIVEVEK
jgi:hypothetical protein